MSRTFAIGDIHGCAGTFEKLLFEVMRIEKSDIVYLLGDYIDRGPNSKGVVDLIIEMRNSNYQFNTLRGNHEQLFIDSEKDEHSFLNWISNGGVTTLQSFGIMNYEQLKEEYKSFFTGTKFYFETKNFIFVHAGLNFQNPDLFEDTHSMLWIRGMKTNKQKLGNKIIVHGHTPTPLEQVKKNLNLMQGKNFINIDTGCAMKEYFGYGFLSALEVSTMKLYSVKNND